MPKRTHRLLLEVPADGLQVHERVDTQRSEDGGVSDTGELQEMRGVDRTCCEDDFEAGVGGERATGVCCGFELDAGCADVRGGAAQEDLRGSVRYERQPSVTVVLDWGQVRRRGGGPVIGLMPVNRLNIRLVKLADKSSKYSLTFGT